MCGPKQARLRTTASTRQTLAPQNSIPKTLADETAGFEELDLSFSRPFNSFTAPVGLPDNSRTSGLRFPLSPKKKDQDDGFIPTLDPASRDRQDSDLGSVYNFGEDTPNGKLSDKIARGIQDNHRLMRENNNQYPASLDETFIDEALGSFDLKKSIKTFQDKYGAHDPNDPEAIGYDYKSAQLHNQKVRRDFIKDQQTQRERENKHPSAYSEEGVSVEELQGRKLSKREIDLKRSQRDAFYRKIKAIGQYETLTSIENSRTLQDDDNAERLWVEFNKRVKRVVVPSIVLGMETTKETYRQTAILAQDTLNNVIRAKNFFTLRETKEGDLIVIPKPEVSKNPAARLLGAFATMFIPGAVGAKALKGIKIIQSMKKGGSFSKNVAFGFERGTGSIITTNERDSLVAHAFKGHPELFETVNEYFEGKGTITTVRDKLFSAVEDGFPHKKVNIVITIIKTLKRADLGSPKLSQLK